MPRKPRSMRGLGPWVPLSARYYFDERVADVEPLAELLYVRGLAYCAASMTDGRMTLREVRSVIAVGLDGVDLDALIKQLLAAGLWTGDAQCGPYVIRQWERWNYSAQEIKEYRSFDAMRKREERKSTRSPDGQTAESRRSPSGVQRKSRRSPNDVCNTDTDTHTGTPSGPKGPDRTESPRDARASAPPDLTGVRRQLAKAASSSRAAGRRRTEAGGDAA